MHRIGVARVMAVFSIGLSASAGLMACTSSGSGGGGASGGVSAGEPATAGSAGAAAGRTGGASAGGTAAGRPFAAAATPSSATPITVTSATFQPGAVLPTPTAFGGCGGANTSPQLSWSNAPPNTKSYVVTAFDPDAPTGTGFWHWVVFNIPSTVTTLPAGAGSSAAPVHGAQSGYTDFGFAHYGGPCPPAGDPPHHYIFTVYALDVPTVEGAGAQSTGAVVMFSLRGHLLAKGSLEGQFAHQ
jgi:Raf kinase inhibitor-like YbhB/YbcL family protein